VASYNEETTKITSNTVEQYKYSVTFRPPLPRTKAPKFTSHM